MIIYAALLRSVENGQLVVNPLGMAKRIQVMAATLARYGCNAILFPPLTMSQSGATDNADGYGLVRFLDVGQHLNAPTRWGSASDVLSASQSCHKFGIMVLEDAVSHQTEGSIPNYELGADGKADKAMFPKPSSCFSPPNPIDDAFDQDGNAAFGNRVSLQHSPYMLEGVIQSMLWRKRVFGLDGYRFDDLKGTWPGAVTQVMRRVGGWAVGEYFDGNPDALLACVRVVGMKVYDFTLHWAIKAACEGSVSLRALPGNGFYARDPEHAVLFVDSADTDLNNSENVRFNKILGYLLIATLPAAAWCVYAGDFEKYNLAPQIENLMWISTMFAFGGLHWHAVSDDHIAWGRDGLGGEIGWSGGLICAFARQSAAFWTPTVFAPNTHLHDYTGTGPDRWTNADGRVQLNLGTNDYVAYAPAGVNRSIPITARPEMASGDFYDFRSITVSL